MAKKPAINNILWWFIQRGTIRNIHGTRLLTRRNINQRPENTRYHQRIHRNHSIDRKILHGHASRPCCRLIARSTGTLNITTKTAFSSNRIGLREHEILNIPIASCPWDSSTTTKIPSHGRSGWWRNAHEVWVHYVRYSLYSGGTVTLEIAPSSIHVSVTSKHVGPLRGWGCASMAGAGHTRNWERAGLPTTCLIFLILPYGFHLPAIRLERWFHAKITLTQLVLAAYLTTP